MGSDMVVLGGRIDRKLHADCARRTPDLVPQGVVPLSSPIIAGLVLLTFGLIAETAPRSDLPNRNPCQ
jgi:hypothetical protein